MFSRIFLAVTSCAIFASCDRTTTDAPGTAPTIEQESASIANTSTTSLQSSFDALPAPYSQADYNLGRRTFKNCQSCHTITEGGRNLVGPNLHGVFGRTVGTADGFQYSRALEAENFEWTPERLEEWLANPGDYLPGNRMTFAGVRRPADRHAVIAYLMVESGYSSAQNADQEAAMDENPGIPSSEATGEGNE